MEGWTCLGRKDSIFWFTFMFTLSCIFFQQEDIKLLLTLYSAVPQQGVEGMESKCADLPGDRFILNFSTMELPPWHSSLLPPSLASGMRQIDQILHEMTSSCFVLKHSVLFNFLAIHSPTKQCECFQRMAVKCVQHGKFKWQICLEASDHSLPAFLLQNAYFFIVFKSSTWKEGK